MLTMLMDVTAEATFQEGSFVLTATAHRISSGMASLARLFCGAGRAVVRCFIFPLSLWPAGERGVAERRETRGCFGPSRHPDVLLRGTPTRQSQRGVSASLAIGTLASRRSTAALLNPVRGRPKAFGRQPPRAPAGGCKPPAEAAPGSGFRTASGGRPFDEQGFRMTIILGIIVNTFLQRPV